VVHSVNNPFEVVQPDNFTDTLLLDSPFALSFGKDGATVFNLVEKEVLAEGLPIPLYAVLLNMVRVGPDQELWWLDTKAEKLFNYHLATGRARDPINQNKYFEIDSKGNLWLERMFFYDIEQDTLIDIGSYLNRVHPELKSLYILPRSFSIDKEDRFWQGTDQGGIFSYDLATKHIRHFSYDPTNPHSAPSGKISNILIGIEGWIYINSTHAFSIYKPELDRFEHWDESDGWEEGPRRSASAPRSFRVRVKRS